MAKAGAPPGATTRGAEERSSDRELEQQEARSGPRARPMAGPRTGLAATGERIETQGLAATGTPQIVPTVFSRAWGWISDWLITTVCGRNRSTMVRTNRRMPGLVRSTGSSPVLAASS